MADQGERPGTRVLLVDDDEEFSQLVADYLAGEGDFTVAARADGEAGLAAASSGAFDVIVLDVGLPRMSGFDVLRAVRERVATPVIMLTARGDDLDRILGLEIGADDYVAKPCNLRELAARIRAVRRRTGAGQAFPPDAAAPGRRAVLGDLVIETGSQSVFLRGELIALTGAEYLVLEALLAEAGRVVSKDAIARHALGRRLAPYDRSVDVHIGHLRKKLGPRDDGRPRIKTVRGRGYLYATAH